MMKKGYYNYDLCKSCGGKCCTSMAGMYIPSDFKEDITEALILSLLEKGNIAIDWWDGDMEEKGGREQIYYLRARHKGEGKIVGSYGGTCINWSKEKGCSLLDQDRPYQCRKLKPIEKEDGELGCKHLKEDKSDKKGCALAWYDYQDSFDKVVEKFGRKEASPFDKWLK